jgi:predicted nuclease with TOPRIM domain
MEGIIISVGVTLLLAATGAFMWVVRLGEKSNANASEIAELKEELRLVQEKYEQKAITLQELDKALAVIQIKTENIDEKVSSIFSSISDLSEKLERDFLRKGK